MSTETKYLVVKGCAGLGNRLVTVLAAIEYCIRNKRTLVVDWADGQFDETGVNAFDKCFTFKKFTNYTSLDSIAGWNDLSHSSDLFKANKHAGLYDLYIEKQSVFFNRLPHALIPAGALRKLRRRWSPINGKGASLNFGSDLNDNLAADVLYFIDFLPIRSYAALPDNLGISPAISEKIRNFKSEQNLETAVGVHVRYTDKKPSGQIGKLIAHLQKTLNGRPVFLSTDSAEIERQFKAAFERVIIYSKTKPQLSGEGLHQWALYKHEEKMKYVLFEESVMDMFLLSECGELLYQGNSTFSQISAVYHPDKLKCTDWQTIN
jgi:hypothetical protein